MLKTHFTEGHSLTSLSVVFFIASVVFYRLVGTCIPDIDFWGYISFGRLFWSSTYFPYGEVFSYVARKNISIYHEWLTGVVLFKIYEGLGEAGVLGTKYVIGFATAILVYATSRLRSRSIFESAFGFIIASISFGIGFGTFKAQIFTYFFFVLSAFLLENYSAA